jgi:hypothetical protein
MLNLGNLRGRCRFHVAFTSLQKNAHDNLLWLSDVKPPSGQW